MIYTSVCGQYQSFTSITFAAESKLKKFKRVEFVEANSERVLRIESIGTTQKNHSHTKLVSLTKYEVRNCDKRQMNLTVLEGDRTTDLCDEPSLSLTNIEDYINFEFLYQRKINSYLFENGYLRTEVNYMMAIMSGMTVGAMYTKAPLFTGGKIVVGAFLALGAYYFKDGIQAGRTVRESRKLYRSCKSGLYINSLKDELISIETLTDILNELSEERIEKNRE